MSMDFKPNAFAANEICDRVNSSSVRCGVRIIPVSAQSRNTGEKQGRNERTSLGYNPLQRTDERQVG